ncbi:MAG: hypothetical protein ABDK92_00990 [Atribacterota bacterium]
MEKELLYFGETSRFQPLQILSFGDFEVAFRDGELFYFRYQEEELIRRIYVAVRDRNWGTVPSSISVYHFSQDPQGFSVSFSAISKNDEVDFRWQGTVVGESRDTHKGWLLFSMEGEAWNDFAKNRIGICVLLPASFAGKRVTCHKHPCCGGYIEKKRLPESIAPHQPLLDFSRLEVEIAPLSTLLLAFEGDIFEMEDQRNWSDASFKVYSTPLRYPFPVLVRRGERIVQRVTVTFETRKAPLIPLGTRGKSSCHIVVGSTPTSTLPSFGLNLNEGLHSFDEEAQRILYTLQPNHFRVDVDTSLSPKTEEEKIRRAATISQHVNVPLWFALAVSNPQELEGLFDLLPWEGAHRLLISRNHPPWDTPRELIEEAKRLMEKKGLHLSLGGGTKGWFAELNRRLPFLEGIDFVFFAVSPQIHASDNETLIENLPTQEMLCRYAHKITGLPVVLSPITLSVPFNPNATERKKRYLPPVFDPRQWSLFGMLWTLGSVKYASSAEALTYYEVFGPCGIIPLPEVQDYWYKHGYRTFGVSPLSHILKDLNSKEGATIVPTRSTNPLVIDALCLLERSERVLYLWNYTPCPQRLSVAGLTFRIEQGLTFSEKCFEELVSTLEAKPRRWEHFTQSKTTLDVALQPWSVVKLVGTLSPS